MSMEKKKKWRKKIENEQEGQDNIGDQARWKRKRIAASTLVVCLDREKLKYVVSISTHASAGIKNKKQKKIEKKTYNRKVIGSHRGSYRKRKKRWSRDKEWLRDR